MRLIFDKKKINKNSSDWNYCSLADVEKNIKMNTSNQENISLIKGKVENTLNDKKNLPKNISILKLDTCTYESIKLKLEVLFPRIEKGGILIIDNYTNFNGVKIAVDNYFKNKNFKLIYDKISGQIRVNI